MSKQRHEVMAIGNNLKGHSLYIKMTQSLLKTKSVIFFYNYSSTLYYSCTRRPAVLCSMKNMNTITVAHLIAWRISQIKQIRKRITTFFRCIKVITIWMLKSASGKKEIIADLHELHCTCTACRSGSCVLQENPWQYLSGWLWFQSIGAVLSTVSESSTHDSRRVITNGKLRHKK